jgi:hypothetical protein
LCDKFGTTKSLFKFSPTKNLNTQQQNNNKNKVKDTRIRNHVVKSLGFGKRDRRELKREESMEGFKVKFPKFAGGVNGSAIGKNMRSCVRERKRDLGSAGTTEKEERGRWHCWCYMQPTRK